MARGGRNKSRSARRSGGRAVGRAPMTRGAKKSRKSTSAPRKRPWDADESDDDYRFDSDSEADFESYSPKKRSRNSPENRASRNGIAGLEDEDDDDVQRVGEGGSEEDGSVSGKSGFSDEYVVDMSSDGNESEYSSSQRQKRPCRQIVARPEPRCVWIDRTDSPELILPESSQDLLLPKEYVLRALEVYEVCRRFGTIAKLSPFLFEDFCGCLCSRNQNPLLDEVHLALLRAVLKDDEASQVIFGPYDSRDSINVSLHLLDQYTYGEVLRRYVESDERFYNHDRVSGALTSTNYPFVDVEKRLTVLQWLAQQFLATQALRKEIDGDGVIQHDDHCRDCGKPGELLCCDTCPAVYHLGCCNPPLDELPSSGWQCEICILHDVKGVSDCRLDGEKIGQLTRQDTLGYDRHGRRYCFMARRLFVEDEKTGDVFYYSTLAQLRQLFSRLDEDDLELDLCQMIVAIGNAILEQMSTTEDLTEARYKAALEKDPSLLSPYLSVEKRGRLSDAVEGAGDFALGGNRADSGSNEDDVETVSQLIKRMDAMLTRVSVVLEKCDSVCHLPPQEPSSKSTVTRSRTGSLPLSRLMRTPKGFSLRDGPPEQKESMNGSVYDEPVQNHEVVPTPPAAESGTQQRRIYLQYFWFDPGEFFKLGQDQMFMKYNNQFSSNPLSKSPYLRAEERNRVKYMNNRFLMDEEGEFKWPSDLAATPTQLVRMLKSSFLNVANRVPPSFVHPRLSNRVAFYEWRTNLINLPKDAASLASCLAEYEANLRPVVFSETYRTGLGHTKFYRSSPEDREERTRKEKNRRKELTERSSADPSDETTSLVWVKYSLLGGPPNHQIWKLKDEAYRVNGDGKLGGWIWIKKDRKTVWVKQGESGLAAGPAWESNHGQLIEELLSDLQYGYIDFEADAELDRVDENEKQVADGHSLAITTPLGGSAVGQPLCAELPMEFDETTASFEINRLKAVAQLGLRHHVETIDVSSGLAQHSVYYKVAKRSKVLDRLLLHRMKQDEDAREEMEKEKAEREELLREAANRNVCYSYACRTSDLGSECYSSDCRRFANAKASAMQDPTSGVHRLKLAVTSQQNGQPRLDSKLWRRENSGAMPPPPVVQIFRSNNAQPKSLSNVLALPKLVAKKLARKGGVQDSVEGFNSTAKASPQTWPYPCFRPTFQTCWRYLVQKADSCHAVALLFRILYHNIRWDQLAVNRDVDATYIRKFENSTEHRIIAGHQLQPPYGLRLRYRVRVTRVSNEFRSSVAAENETTDESNEEGGANEDDRQDDPSSSSRKSAPWRLRERKVIRKKQRVKDVEKLERWLDDDAFMLWEIKNYWTRRERDVREAKQAAQFRSQQMPGMRGGIAGARPGFFGMQSGLAGPRRSSIGRRGADLQPPILEANLPSNEQETAKSTPSITIPLPEPNASIIIDMGDGNRLMVSNKPQVPGGPCVVTIETVESASSATPERSRLGYGTNAIAKRPRPSILHGRKIPSIPPAQHSTPLVGEELDSEPSEMQDVTYEDDANSSYGVYKESSLSEFASRRTSRAGRDRNRNSTGMRPSNWNDMQREDKKRFQDCKGVLNLVVDRVVADDRSRQREELRHQPKTSRVSYWREYRLKRKTIRLQRNAVTSREEIWRHEILKRRKGLKANVQRAVVRHLTDNVLEKIVQERTLLGWPPPTRPFKRFVSPPTPLPLLPPPVVPIVGARSVPSSSRKRQYIDNTPVREFKRPQVQRSSFSGNDRVSRTPLILTKPRKEKSGPEPTAAVSPLIIQRRIFMERAAQRQAQPPPPPPPPPQQQQELHCICRTPLDRSKFYVMCDLCGRWFHGKCVGITQKKSRSMSTWSCHECQKAKEAATQELYCVCRKPYDEKQSYICCDSCDQWFHCSCVGLSPEEADSLPNFLCPNCSNRQATNHDGAVSAPGEMESKLLVSQTSPASGLLSAVTKSLDAKDYRHLDALVVNLSEHQMSWPFRHEVDSTKYPTYHQFITTHVDFSLVGAKVKCRQYETLTDFSRDVVAIFNNARSYYHPDSPEFQCATVLDQYFTKELHDVKLAISGSAGGGSTNWNGKA